MQQRNYEYKKGNDQRFVDSFLLDHLDAYSQFLSHPLTLSMFVPVDANNNLLDESMCKEGSMATAWYNECKSKVLFEGFKVIGSDDDGIEIEMTDNNIWIIYLSTSINIQHYNGLEWEIKTVEEMFEFLKEYGIQATLSPTALKQIYG